MEEIMNLVNKIVLVVSIIATLVFWIGGILQIGELRYTLLDPQVVGWGGLYINLFKYISLPPSIALIALGMSSSDNLGESLAGYAGAIVLGFVLTIPFTLLWLFVMAIIGLVGFLIAFIAAYGTLGIAALVILLFVVVFIIAEGSNLW